MNSGMETESGLMRTTAKHGADLATQISAKIRGLDGGMSTVLQTLRGQMLSPLTAGHTNSVDAFDRLARTLNAVAENINLSANKYEAMDGANQANLARHVDPVAGGGPATGTGGSGIELNSLRA